MFHCTKRVFTAIALSAVSSIALAHSYERCDADGDHCVRVSCDHDGDRCWRESEYSKNAIYSGPGRWVCDSDGVAFRCLSRINVVRGERQVDVMCCAAIQSRRRLRLS